MSSTLVEAAAPVGKPGEAPRRITILGSTGSVGLSTLDLIERDPGAYQIEALTANRRVKELAEQALRLRPRRAVIAEESGYGALKEALAGSGVEAAAGAQAVIEAAEMPADWVMSAIVGAAGLEPTLAAVRRGAVIGLANKETLVCAGALMMAEIERHGATLLPVDSEHNAIFQVLDTAQRDSIDRLILTCSGGPFRGRSWAEMADVTPEQAVAHPNWSMGAKISVDSATLMNKGLELIEACHLFAMPQATIEIVIHPQSVIHSMVGYIDGSVLAQMGTPDMRTPIAYTLAWPGRMAAPVERLDFAKVARLTFEDPDPVLFPALALARAALETGGAAPTRLNAANEVAVHAFLQRRIGFLDIARVVGETLEALPARPLDSLEDVREADAEARRHAGGLVGGTAAPAVAAEA